MACQSVGERGRLLRAMGLAWVIVPTAEHPSSPQSQTRQSPRRPANPVQHPALPTPQHESPSLIASTGRTAFTGVLRALFHGKQCPVQTLWTYVELWDDLHAPRPPRLDLIKKIQSACAERLGWDTTRMALWPCHCPEPHIWEQGLALWRPQCLLIFGQEALRQILPKHQASPEPFPWEDMLIAPLPDLSTMLVGNAQAKAQTWQVLQRIHS